MNKTFESLCTPAKIYLVIAAIASVIALSNNAKFGGIAVRLFFAFLWTYVLSFLCKKGYDNLSWFLVLFPYVVILLVELRIANLTKYNTILTNVGLQGAYGREGMKSQHEKKSMMSDMTKM